MSISKTIAFNGADAVQITATSFGDETSPPVLLLHGAGQTRHSWRAAALALAAAGWRAIAIDTRGHGDSTWPDNGDYSIDSLIADLHLIVGNLTMNGGPRPAVVGASLGGITALIAQGETLDKVFSALVLVDITPRIDPNGVERILQFMRRHSDGFENLQEAADAVRAYQPNRGSAHGNARKKVTDPNHVGLKKNLRLDKSGRYYWHWDPRLLDHVGAFGEALVERQRIACRHLSLPVLLVHGRLSEIVSDDSARDFLQLVPRARYVNVADAAHMVAGDDNDVFSTAVIDFLVDACDP